MTNDEYYQEFERLLIQGLSVEEAKAELVLKYGDYGEEGSETKANK